MDSTKDRPMVSISDVVKDVNPTAGAIDVSVLAVTAPDSSLLLESLLCATREDTAWETNTSAGLLDGKISKSTMIDPTERNAQSRE